MVDYDPQDAVKEAHDLRKLLLNERDHTLRLRLLLSEAEESLRATGDKDKTLAHLLGRIREELPKK
jgi:hypothetical protein